MSRRKLEKPTAPDALHSEVTSEAAKDLTLFALVKDGNQLAFHTLYDRYWEKLFAYTYNRLHAREASEEVVQDVFLSLWAKRESITITVSLSAYLFGATRHRLLNEIRSAKMRNSFASDYANFARNEHDNSTVELQDLKDLENSISSKMSDLPERCQAVFVLSRREHISNKHIAEKLKISTKTVENYLTQALKHLKTTLGQLL